MSQRLLSGAMIAFGAVFLLITPLAIVWPAGWAWHDGSPMANPYFPMIVAVYAVLGVFLIRAASDPAANASLIWFTVWSSLAHAAVMAVQSLQDPNAMGHLLGDVPALLLVAGVLSWGMMSLRRSADNRVTGTV